MGIEECSVERPKPRSVNRSKGFREFAAMAPRQAFFCRLRGFGKPKDPAQKTGNYRRVRIQFSKTIQR
jgi:hypothetical protein